MIFRPIPITTDDMNLLQNSETQGQATRFKNAIYFSEVLEILKQVPCVGRKYEPQICHVWDMVCECYRVCCKRHLSENSVSVCFHNRSATCKTMNTSTRSTSHIGTNSVSIVTLLPIARKNLWKSVHHAAGYYVEIYIQDDSIRARIT